MKKKLAMRAFAVLVVCIMLLNFMVGCSKKEEQDGTGDQGDPSDIIVEEIVFDYDEVPMTEPPELYPKANVLDSGWIQLYLPEVKYDVEKVTDTSLYVVSSSEDDEFAEGINPDEVNHRYYVEYGMYRTEGDHNGKDADHRIVIYRIFLKLPSKLKEGMSYQVIVNKDVFTEADEDMSFDVKFDNSIPNEAIHVNQVAYLSGAVKHAYLSWWTGIGNSGAALDGRGSINYDHVEKFELINEETGETVFTGDVEFVISGKDDIWGGADLYMMDFTDFTQEGTYYIYIPEVGRSYSFKISKTAFNEIGYTLLRALTLQRDGDHGLTPEITQWSRPPAHLDDAIDEVSGERVDLVGGHMDAGDRGKYPHNSALTIGAMLAALQLFPEKVEGLGEYLDIPESGNGIPDIVDELVYELDWLYKAVMNTSQGGLLGKYVRPSDGTYETGAPPEGQEGRVFFNKDIGPLRSETLAAAGALAMAYNNPIIQKYLPDKAEQYKEAAIKAFSAFEENHDSDIWANDDVSYDSFHPFTLSEDGRPIADESLYKWSDELLFAAANLLEATGDKSYLDWINQHMPKDLSAVKKWGWSLEGVWLYTFLSLYNISDENSQEGLKEKAYFAIIGWAEDALGWEKTYDVYYHRDLSKHVGWYMSGSMLAYPMMMAYGLTGDEKYKEQISLTWNYLLGANPLSRSHISGLGQPDRRPRWLVHELSVVYWDKYQQGDEDGWSEVPPGLPLSDIQEGQWPTYLRDRWNLLRKEEFAPAVEDTPVLWKYGDDWNNMNEFVIHRLARQAVSIIPLVAVNE